MALAYLLDPTNQYQNVAGVNNVAGWFEVFISGTPERADVYVDFAGTRAPERIAIDNDGRAVMVVDGDGVYRVEMHAPNGDLLWTQYPVWPAGQGGGGAIGVDIGSSDGSIDVQRTQVGSVVNYDLSVAADSTDLLGWGEFVGYTMDGTHMVPSYSAGTIVAGQHGIRLQAGQYYHVTGALGASSVEQNVYDAFQVSFRGVDGDGAVSTYSTKSFHYDASTGEGQSYDVSFDMLPATDVEMYAEATGLESGISVGISEVYVHRVYSGAPAIPDGVADKPWVEENYQEKLTPGTGITIDENNVISTTGSDTEIYTVEYGGHGIEEGTVFDEAYAAYLVGKTLVLKGSNFTGTLCHYSSTYGLLFSVMYANMSGSGPTAVTDGGVTYYWLYKYGTQSRWGNSGVTFLPRRYSADAGKVLMVDPQYPTATPIWASLPDLSAYVTDTELDTILEGYVTAMELTTALSGKQDVISDLSDIRAGAALGATAVQDANYVHTDNNFTNSDVVKLSGIEAGAEVNVQANWNESDSSSDSFILNKPTIPSGSQLVPAATQSDAGEVLTVDQNGVPEWAPAQAPISAGDGIDITNNVVSAKVDGTSVTFNANGELEATAAPQVQSDWAESDQADVSFIRNKPGQTNLVAGANITIVDDAQNNTVTISAASVSVPVQDVTIDNVSVVNAQGVAEIPRQVNADWNSSAGASEILNKPSIPVIGTITL